MINERGTNERTLDKTGIQTDKVKQETGIHSQWITALFLDIVQATSEWTKHNKWQAKHGDIVQAKHGEAKSNFSHQELYQAPEFWSTVPASSCDNFKKFILW